MDWTSAGTVAAINGLHITLWLLAYGVWRLLMSPRWNRQVSSSADSESVRARRRRGSVEPQTVEGRWERRAEMLAKMKRPGRTQVELPARRRRAA